MALRSTFITMRAAAGGAGNAGSANSKGLQGLIERIKVALSTGKLLRQDVVDDNLRLPAQESGYRSPSPGSQLKARIPQGKYKNIFDIAYHSRDARRKITRESVEAYKYDAQGNQLPPTPGIPNKGWQPLGYAGEFDVHK
eukprot:CAMPEP_0184700604 /NCGR_PEP_ID=MMETSP0313-20130426/14688_1 /TAXON_ID=2792 /ORGANISM="Porphyridium aerugineum, Strain SAG 1380-2" /LENGTH=139 /DNA_ID=CAMNT_0027160359 /DNA_START=109 /DNA_END=528 /DNA_ORIENTATION=-